MRKIVISLLFMGSLALPALGDIPRPKSPTPVPKPKAAKSLDGRIYVDLKSKVKVPTLKIRRETFNELRAAMDEAEGSKSPAAAISGSSFSRSSTIVSGLLFSLALVFAGVLLFRKRTAASPVAMSAFVLSVLGAGAVIVFGNTPPSSVVGLTTRIFDKRTKVYGYAAGNIRIEVLDREPGVFTGNDSDDVILENPDGGEDNNAE